MPRAPVVDALRKQVKTAQTGLCAFGNSEYELDQTIRPQVLTTAKTRAFAGLLHHHPIVPIPALIS
jgi:hypothetical protein